MARDGGGAERRRRDGGRERRRRRRREMRVSESAVPDVSFRRGRYAVETPQQGDWLIG